MGNRFTGGIVINFRQIQLEDKPVFDEFFRQQYYENAHFNFTNLFMWRNAYQIEWAVEEDFLYTRASWGDQKFVMQPFGPQQHLGKAVEKWLNYFCDLGVPFMMSGVEAAPAAMIEQSMPGKLLISSDRDNYDYVYRVQDLIDLKGRSYHSKKNHVNSFRKNYSNYQYLSLTDDLIGQCVDNIIEWCRKHGCYKDPILLAEKNAIIEVLNNFEALQLTGGVIVIDGKVEAFCFGEQLNTDTAVIHVEKANPEIRGAYAAINQEFCRNNLSHLEYVNREEDMGIPGLRKAKQSYHPVKMVEKYIITQKGKC